MDRIGSFKSYTKCDNGFARRAEWKTVDHAGLQQESFQNSRSRDVGELLRASASSFYRLGMLSLSSAKTWDGAALGKKLFYNEVA